MRRRAGLVAVAVLLALTAGSAASGGFNPIEGRYVGAYTSRSHGPGGVLLKVGGFLRPERRELPAVRLVRWSGKLRCPGHRTRREATQMSAARIGRTFSGFMFFPGGKVSFTGRFTSESSLVGTVRVRRASGGISCDTGPVRFVARLG